MNINLTPHISQVNCLGKRISEILQDENFTTNLILNQGK